MNKSEDVSTLLLGKYMEDKLNLLMEKGYYQTYYYTNLIQNTDHCNETISFDQLLYGIFCKYMQKKHIFL